MGGIESLADLLVHAADRAPHASALIGIDDAWSWAEVEHLTSVAARALRHNGIVAGDRIGIARPKSEHSFLSVHAVLRAGAVVVPIDPLAPVENARAVLAHSGARALIGDAATIGRLDPWSMDGGFSGLVIATGDVADSRMIPWDDLMASPVEAIELPRCPVDDPAYLIFTSGSTGAPKGILHTHRSGLAYAALAAEAHGLGVDDRVAAMCPIHFDMSTLELYAAPLAGSTIVAMSEAQLRFPASLVERCASERTTVWYAVPFQLRSMVDRGVMDERDLSTVRSVIYAGEPYPPHALAELMRRLPAAEITNAYGPAEVNVCTTHSVTEMPDTARPVPIGRPWGDTRARVVDEDGFEVTAGAVGELWISSDTMMLGYWGEPDLTEASISEHDGLAWYRTGDLVAADPDGVLRFHGRNDNQVKVRGTRLELQAVEDTIAQHPDVDDSIVAAIGDGDGATHLAAAVLTVAGAEVDERALRRWCGSRLAAVAVPHRFEQRESWPTTSSGKVDRAVVRRELTALSALTTTRPPSDHQAGDSSALAASKEGRA